MTKRTPFLTVVTIAGIVGCGLSCAGSGSGGETGSAGSSAMGGSQATGSGGTSGTGGVSATGSGGQAQTGGASGSGGGGAIPTGGSAGGGAAGSSATGGGGAGGSASGGSSATGGTGGAGTGGTGAGGAGPGGAGGTCSGAICNAKTWSDITSAHSVPAWLKNAKLGIGMHFMVATVPAYHNEWFIQHEYCNSAFATWTSQNFPAKSPMSGGPWGYKDFIPLFTCAKWSMPELSHQATTAAS